MTELGTHHVFQTLILVGRRKRNAHTSLPEIYCEGSGSWYVYGEAVQRILRHSEQIQRCSESTATGDFQIELPPLMRH